MQMMNKFLKAAAVGVAVIAASSANAFVVDDTSDDFTINWDLAILNGTQHLTATALFDVTSISGSQVIFNITLTNTTAPSSFQASIVSLGFYVDPNATSASITNNADAITWEVDLTQPNFPGGFQSIDVCLFAANNCQGGNINQGLLNNPSPNSDDFILTLNGSFPDGLDFADTNNFPIKFQTQAGSFEFTGTSTSSTSSTSTTSSGASGTAPEPGTLSLLGGAILAGLFRYRRSQQARV
jgi:hypothetical protein